MSADKTQSVQEALADVFNASNPDATGTVSTLDHETLSDAFSQPRPNESGSNGSPARFDHATLTAIFREPPTEIRTSFDQNFAEIINERPQFVTDTQACRPGFDHQVVAEILSEHPTIFANPQPSQPSFDHQALAEMLTEARGDAIDPRTFPLGFDTEPWSSSEPSSGQVQQAEPAAHASTTSSLTTAEGARPPRAKSLLAKLHQIFSTKEAAVPFEDASSRSLADQFHTHEPTARAISSSAHDTQQHDSLLPERPAVSLEQEPKSPQPSRQPDGVQLVASDVAASCPTDAASAWPLPATSPGGEISPPVSIIAAAKIVATAAPLDANGYARMAAEPALLLPTHNETTQPQTRSLLLADPPELYPTNKKPLRSIVEQDFLSPSLPGQPNSVVPSVKSVMAHAEDAPPQLASSLSAALHVLNAKPSSPIIEKEVSRPTPASQLDHAGMSAKATNDPTDAESVLAQQTTSLRTEIPAQDSADTKSLGSNSKEEPSSSSVSHRPADVARTANAVSIGPPADTEIAVARAQQAKLLLTEMDLNTAIHLRWVMRDIKSKRTKFSPVSADDLTALVNLGFVELREGLPRLTGLGILALD